MRLFYPALAALLCISSLCMSSAALAQNDVRAPSPSDEQHPVVASAGSQPFAWIVRNANDCAPDRAQAVWGASATPIGYACAGGTR